MESQPPCDDPIRVARETASSSSTAKSHVAQSAGSRSRLVWRVRPRLVRDIDGERAVHPAQGAGIRKPPRAAHPRRM